MNMVFFDGYIKSVGETKIIGKGENKTPCSINVAVVYDYSNQYMSIPFVCLGDLVKKMEILGSPRTKVIVRGRLKRFPQDAEDEYLRGQIYIEVAELVFDDPFRDDRFMKNLISQRRREKTRRTKARKRAERERLAKEQAKEEAENGEEQAKISDSALKAI